MSSRCLRYISMGCLNMSLLMIDRQNDPVFSFNVCCYGTKRFDQDIQAELIKFLPNQLKSHIPPGYPTIASIITPFFSSPR